MKKMNKNTHTITKGVLALLTVAALGLTACGTEPSSSQQSAAPQKASTEQVTDNTEAKPVVVEKQQEGYVFESNGVSIGVDMDVEPVVEALGEPKSVFEQPSCAGQGTAYLYTYSGFEINTYPENDVNYIAYILLKDDTVATPEGVDLSMTKADIIAAYGEDYTEEDNKLTYKSGNMSLNFLLDGDSIVSIEYDSGVLN